MFGLGKPKKTATPLCDGFVETIREARAILGPVVKQGVELAARQAEGRKGGISKQEVMEAILCVLADEGKQQSKNPADWPTLWATAAVLMMVAFEDLMAEARK